MTSRDELLQTLQEVTGFDDIAMCMSILEQCNWNLEAAVNSLMPQDHYFNSAANVVTPQNPSTIQTVSRDDAIVSAELIRITVMYGNDRHTVPMPLTSTLKDLKERLRELTGLECSRQKIGGLPPDVTDKTQFYDKKYDRLKNSSILFLDEVVPESYLFPRQDPLIDLTSPDPKPTTVPIQAVEDLQREAAQLSSSQRKSNPVPKVEVVEDDDDDDDDDDNINYEDLSTTTTEDDEEEEEECCCGGYERMESNQSCLSEQEGGSQEEDNNEGFDEDLFCDDNGASYETKAPLIPEDCEDPTKALECFTSCFTARYGELHPLFYIGSLSDAIKECMGVPANERRPMFIYLHHDESVLSNIFCSQLLCTDSIVTYLTQHFLVWAWDLTKECLKRRLLDMVKDSFGTSIATDVDAVKPDSLPVILIVYKSKGQIMVQDVIQGMADPDKLLTVLMTAQEQHQLLAAEDYKDEQDRLAREEMKRAQERAFQDSLLADKEKERQRLEEEEIRQIKELADQEERQKRERERQEMMNSIPPEPDQSSVEKVSAIRMRFPDGTVDQRRFLADTHTVQMILNYVGSKGYPSSDYKILTSYPKRNIVDMDSDLTLLQAKLYPTETLHIEDDS